MTSALRSVGLLGIFVLAGCGPNGPELAAVHGTGGTIGVAHSGATLVLGVE